MSLGNALFSLGERETGTAYLEQAVAAYRLALRKSPATVSRCNRAMAEMSLGGVLVPARASGRAARRIWSRRSLPTGLPWGIHPRP